MIEPLVSYPPIEEEPEPLVYGPEKPPPIYGPEKPPEGHTQESEEVSAAGKCVYGPKKPSSQETFAEKEDNRSEDGTNASEGFDDLTDLTEGPHDGSEELKHDTFLEKELAVSDVVEENAALEIEDYAVSESIANNSKVKKTYDLQTAVMPSGESHDSHQAMMSSNESHNVQRVTASLNGDKTEGEEEDVNVDDEEEFIYRSLEEPVFTHYDYINRKYEDSDGEANGLAEDEEEKVIY